MTDEKDSALRREEALGPVRYRWDGPDRCDVPGHGLVRKGEVVEFKSEVHAHGAPFFPERWTKVVDEEARADGQTR
ncbi:MAG: hypothetical protein ACE5FA_00015 [Dehalococcoidia bacterium]